MRGLLASLVVSLILLPAAARADDTQHAVAPSTLATTVAGHAAEQDANRAAIRAALARPEVRDVADKAGVDLNHANAVDTLDGAALDQAASIARQVSQQLSGGASTVVISTTTVIIILLLVLLIVVAVK